MTVATEYKFIGHGVYSIVEAARLSECNPAKVTRWTRGYDYKVNGEVRHTDPVILPTELWDGVPVLQFVDVIEIKFLNHWREKCRVGLKTIRLAAPKARELTGTTHPFSSGVFHTTGKDIIAALGEEYTEYHNILTQQIEHEITLGPFLKDQLEFDEDDKRLPQRYWPLLPRRTVVVDKDRSFGAPVVLPSNIQTATLYSAYMAEGEDASVVADWYEVDQSIIADAVEFENSLAA